MDGKTIAQIAEEIGVTKQAIQKKMKKEPLQTVLALCITKKGTAIYINADGEKLIKSEYGIKTTTSAKKKPTTGNPKLVVKDNMKTPVKLATTGKVADNKQLFNDKNALPTTKKATATKQDKQVKDTATTEKTVTKVKEQPTNTNKELPSTTKEETTTRNENRNYYEILGVPTTATTRELNIAWTKLTYKSNNTQAEKDYLYEIMKVLCKSETRLEYDKKIGVVNLSAQQEKKVGSRVTPKKESATEPHNIYELLGVSPTATENEISLILAKANYNFFDSLCEDYKPTEKQKAMDILAYPEKRHEYDIKQGFKEK